MDNLFLLIIYHDTIYSGGSMKKGLIILIIFMMFTVVVGCSKKEVKETIKNKVDGTSLMEFDKYKDIELDKVKSITYSKLTVAGRDDEEITEKDRISRIYNQLKNIKVGKEITNACEDNTKIYVFNMDDDKKISVELECEWLVLGNKRYEIR